LQAEYRIDRDHSYEWRREARKCFLIVHAWSTPNINTFPPQPRPLRKFFQSFSAPPASSTGPKKSLRKIFCAAHRRKLESRALKGKSLLAGWGYLAGTAPQVPNLRRGHPGAQMEPVRTEGRWTLLSLPRKYAIANFPCLFCRGWWKCSRPPLPIAWQTSFTAPIL
jgi:hypothetical protein